MDRTRLTEILKSPDSFTTVILATLIDEWQSTEMLDWDPVTLTIELRDLMKVTPPTWLTDRINAGILILTTDMFNTSIEAFTSCCSALNGKPVSGQTFIPSSLEDCAWGVTEASLLAGPEAIRAAPFAEDIKAYIGKLLQVAGITPPPPVLGFAEDYIMPTEDVLTDPDMNQAAWDQQKRRSDEIENLIKDRLLTLFRQLGALDLKDANPDLLQKFRDMQS